MPQDCSSPRRASSLFKTLSWVLAPNERKTKKRERKGERERKRERERERLRKNLQTLQAAGLY
jgi:hypothetical protein